MRSPDEPSDLLATIPFGKLLARLLRLLVSSDRRDEFVGDLVEQANNELAGRPRGEIGLWLWGQTLQSAPALVALRVRRLARRATLFPTGLGPRRSARPSHHFPGLLIGNRVAQRSWPVPMAVSVSIHAMALFGLLASTLRHIEEVEAPWVPVALGRALATLTPAPMGPIAEPAPPQPAPEPKAARKPRPAARPLERAPVVADAPAPAPTVGSREGHDPAGGHRAPQREVALLSPPVGEKRCLSCPAPKLPPAFVRLGAEQQILVKTCVDASGDVTSVDVLRGLGADADAGIVDTVRGWRFSPHSVGDHPVPFCYPTRFLFSMN